MALSEAFLDELKRAKSPLLVLYSLILNHFTVLVAVQAVTLSPLL